MPCYDGRDNCPSDDRLVRELRERNAMLCAVLSVLDTAGQLRKVLEYIDWKAAGVTRGDLELWFRDHKLADKVKNARNTETNLMQKRKADALKKLTYEEQQLLGIKK